MTGKKPLGLSDRGRPVCICYKFKNTFGTLPLFEEKHQQLNVFSLEKIELDTYFEDKPVHVEIGATMGAGEVYHVTINKYHNGAVWKTNDGCRYDLNSKTILQGNDVVVIIELIESNSLVASIYRFRCLPPAALREQNFSIAVRLHTM